MISTNDDENDDIVVDNDNDDDDSVGHENHDYNDHDIIQQTIKTCTRSENKQT